MAMNRAQFAKMLEPGLNTLFGLEYDSYPAEYAPVFALVSVKTGLASIKVLRDKEVALCILKVPPLSFPSTNIPIA